MKQPESTADFKARIAALMREREGRPVEILGAAHADPCLVRKPTDRGYNPPATAWANKRRVTTKGRIENESN